MRIAILFISIVWLLTSCDYGYDAHGTVIDAQTNQKLEKVSVVSLDRRFDALTDSNGYFADTFLYGRRQPVMPVTFAKDGYYPIEIPDVFALEKPIELKKIPPPSFDTVYEFVEKMPEFIEAGGDLNLYIARNFIYPTQDEVQMSFTASFIIDTMGKVVSPQIIRVQGIKIN
jgi:hypothetical protein